MKRKKILAIFMIVLVAISLVACGGSDEVQEDLLKYINFELPKIAELESLVIELYESVSGDNYIDDETMYYTIQEYVIPSSLELIDLSESITPKTKDVREVHETYISAINNQNSAFTIILSALEYQDYDKMTKANEKLRLSRKQMRDFVADVGDLADKHNVILNQ